MNYALDAIWWRLRHPAVRDLASLLTAPPLWHSGCELPIPRLLGSQGFRFLLNLDSQPAPLQQWLEQEAPFGHRLGHYAESLLAFWMAHAPHCQLIARNHPIRSESGQTLGAADFLCLLDSTPYHLELTCKYYGGTTPDNFQGLNPTDTLLGKAAKLQQQCRLLHTPQARAQLPAPLQGYLKTSAASFCEAKTSKASFCEAKTNEASPCEVNTSKTDCRQPQNFSQALNTATIIRGIGFTPNGILNGSPLNPLGWSGLLLPQWADYPAQATQRFHPLPRLAYLVPARVPFEQTISAAELAHQAPGLIAVVEQRPDGMWHETQRLMCRG
ncbi:MULTISPECIES: DUF1853 family protein [unclassified Eikenella]|uniref:DUF1853 family protein n=1 Tax=unclassified Eikenella TaxID=2639367 RepID=UPI0008A3623F|nr:MULTISPECIES: DUF1853 family protein [unclassified Eikenella]OFK86290.1 hypothetical protein HMPREF2796_10315 [Eikenella sp. HMSC071B05]OFO44345.1 hypothetical protein HMPREF3043_09990 [Eikenella sp. HMSC073A11]